ncbi:hypothetical protein ACOBQX_16470 [Actinokineospora sp. G85]|uniref:hypothetical protein n=1 Tax=Actinokineospora sp. G85 TaxID=3406626 RepID=UPI003C75C5CB
MQRRAKTLAAGLVLTISTTTAGLLLGTTPASAAEPVVASTCGATVTGAPGAVVSISAGAVTKTVTDILDPTLVGLLGISNALKKLPVTIPVGVIGTSDSEIDGKTVAGAVGKLLPVGPVLNNVLSVLSGPCKVVVKVVNSVVAPAQEAAPGVGETVGGVTGPVVGPVADALPKIVPGAPSGGGGTNPGGGGGTTNPGNPNGGGGGGAPAPGATPGSTSGTGTSLTPGGLPLYDLGLGFGRSPMTDYASIPFTKAGLFSPSPGVRYGGSVPGYAPEFGILGSDDADGVHQAGQAEAIDGIGGNRIAMPVLLAVLLLSGVTAALVRTWVLRRTLA